MGRLEVERSKTSFLKRFSCGLDILSNADLSRERCAGVSFLGFIHDN